jgi:hypothetical protein
MDRPKQDCISRSFLSRRSRGPSKRQNSSPSIHTSLQKPRSVLGQLIPFCTGSVATIALARRKGMRLASRNVEQTWGTLSALLLPPAKQRANPYSEVRGPGATMELESLRPPRALSDSPWIGSRSPSGTGARSPVRRPDSPPRYPDRREIRPRFCPCELPIGSPRSLPLLAFQLG